MRHFLDFEKPIAELEGKIEELRRMSEPDGLNIAEEVARLRGIPLARVEQASTENFFRLFRPAAQ